MNKILTLLICLFSLNNIGATETLTITEQTIKIKSEKNFYYAFQKGDKIFFDLKVIKGKSVKEVEILEYPSNSLLSDFKTKEISNKEITIKNTGVYRFRIKAGGISSKVCKLKISRLPYEVNSNFNTNVKWINKIDSTYSAKERLKLVSTDTIAVDFLDRIERVHSTTNINSHNTTDLVVSLPQNQYSELSSSEVISWSYWIGVGDEGNHAFEQAKKEYLKGQTQAVSSLINPMAGLALGAYTMLYNPPNGDNIKYDFFGVLDGEVIYIAQGNSVTANERMTNILQGDFTVRLENNNLMEGVNVNIKMTAIIEKKIYEIEEYKELATKNIKVPVIDN